MSATIKDVAALAGVSPSTVSRTRKNHPSISRETKEKVRQAMLQLGYEPNFPASSLAGKSSRTIGLILPPSQKEACENPFYLQVIRGICQYCNPQQYITTMITGRDDGELLQMIRTMSRSSQAAGFLLLYSRRNDPVSRYLFEKKLCCVLLGKPYQYANQTVYIDNDNLLAGQEATEYLYHLGHQKIAFLGSSHDFLFSDDRKNGYQLALTRLGLSIRPEYCIEMSGADDTKGLCRLLTGRDRPTAILVSDDILAMSLERICLENGISIPKDLSVLSFNNSLFARLTSPQLTSIDVNAGQLGMEAAAQMIQHIEHPRLPATKSIVPHFLVERDSCRRIPMSAF